MGAIRDHWRILLLVVALVGSGVALFAPGIGGSGGPQGPGAASAGPTNLDYGLELSGGTRIRAPLVGVTAEEVQFGNDSPGAVERQVAANLQGVDVSAVTARQTGQNVGTVEVTVENVTTGELERALSQAGYPHGQVREGVTDATRQQAINVLKSKINQAGLSGGSVQAVTTSTGERFVLIEVPNQDRSEVIDLVNERGTVSVQVYYQPNDSGNYTRKTVLEQGDFQSIESAQRGQGGQPPSVGVVIKEDVAERLQKDLVQTGVAGPGGSRCTYQQNPNGTEPCLLLVSNGEVVSAFGVEPGLAQSLRSGEWAQNPTFSLQTGNFSEAQEVAVNLRAGALPAPLDVGPGGEGSSSYVSPSQGASFKTNSLLTGIIAVLAVSGVVFVRYRRLEVSLPMVVTALSEVVILLGLAAAIGYPLDLSVIAGFIAVIGTGVDDLIIIADEVLTDGGASSRRVFQSRFRRAFWVIGAAAATTIIAMSPLAVLSLGDLKGFAIFTILGVLVGVLITRPAYGDILRVLTTGDR